MMRHSFKRVGYLLAAILLGLIGATSIASGAWAQRQGNTLIASARVQGCAFLPCAQDVVTIPAGTAVTTYCVRANYNVTYTGPSTGRGGFVDRSRFQSPGAQTENCNTAGVFAQVSGSANVRACSSNNCVDLGDAFNGNTVGVFCRLGPTNDRWYLLYVDDTTNAGFLPASALSQQVNVSAC
jgi:hypothetical protein